MNKEQKELVTYLEGIREIKIPNKSSNKYIFLKNKEISPQNGIQLLASFMQIILGTVVVALSVVELIQPTWLAALMSILGSISVITGLILAYSVLTRTDDFQSLVKMSIKRVILFQN